MLIPRPTQCDHPGQWARWCRTRGYLLGDDGSRRPGYERIRAPILAYSFTDDGFAPRETVAAWLGFFPHAQVTHRHLAPADAGVKAVGHFGFFRPLAEQTLWPQVAQWLAAHPTQPAEAASASANS